MSEIQNIRDESNFSSPSGVRGRVYTIKEEKANTFTHAVGVALSVIGGVFLIQKAIVSGNNWAIFSYTVFPVFMTLMFLSSTLYHFEKDEKIKSTRNKFDHAAIYSQIAGSYTPFTLVVLREHGAWGWSIFGIIWAAALAGIIVCFSKIKNGGKIETICYVAMGWVMVIAFKPLIDVMTITNSMHVLWWLIAGGLLYTVGAVLYQFKKIQYMHAIWHLFVLGGGICHFIAIWEIKI